MELDFYDQFKEYSNIDLLKIVNHPQGYQATAIEAASEILKDRHISDKEIRATENYFIEKEAIVRLMPAGKKHSFTGNKSRITYIVL